MISSSPIRKRTTRTEGPRNEEESLDDELSDEDEVISAGGAIEEEEDLDEPDTDDGEDAHDGVADRDVHEAGRLDGPVRVAQPAPPADGRS